MSGAPVGRVVRADTMSEVVAHLLAETPRVHEPERQRPLTERFMTPAIPALEALFLHLRAELDAGLRQARPLKSGKPYPLGQCLEICSAVGRRLGGVDPVGLPGPAAEGYAALSAFAGAGGHLQRAWGDLRGRCFQNAMIAGSLYIDVANDTVVVTKPKVEILPFAAAGFTPVADYLHYARIAGVYWGARMLPNHLLPELAPYAPLIQIAASGQLSLGPQTRHMLGVTLARAFAPSEEALAAPPLHPATFAALSAALRDGPTPVAASPEGGRTAALEACRNGRAGGRADSAAAFTQALAAIADANRRLAGLTHPAGGLIS